MLNADPRGDEWEFTYAGTTTGYLVPESFIGPALNYTLVPGQQAVYPQATMHSQANFGEWLISLCAFPARWWCLPARAVDIRSCQSLTLAARPPPLPLLSSGCEKTSISVYFPTSNPGNSVAMVPVCMHKRV